jgi:hypothetical protein
LGSFTVFRDRDDHRDRDDTTVGRAFT